MILFVFLIIFCYASGEDELLQKCYGECGCGLSNRSFGGFPNSLPFTGQLRISYKPCPNFMIKCSAIIIDEKFIITAKRCLIFDLFAIHKHCRTTTIEARENTIKIKEQRYHSPENIKFYIQSNASDENDENLFQIKTLLPLTWQLAKLDVVMLELSKKIVFSIERRPACIYGGYTPTSGDVLRFSGYGKDPDDIMLSISPAVCKSIKKQSKGKIQCAKFLSAPSEQCINRLKEEQSQLPEEVQEGNSQNTQEVWSDGRIEDPDFIFGQPRVNQK